MTLKFTPPKKSARYALFVENGNDPERGSFKTFNDLGAAKASYHFAHYGYPNAKILENVEGEWYVLHDIKDVHSYKELPWVKEVQGDWSYRTASYGANDHRAKPMTREEYAEWRLAVEREKNASNIRVSSNLRSTV